MAGTLRGMVDSRVVGNRYQASGIAFKTVFDTVEAHPGTTRIALYYGIGASGTDYHDGVNPFGNAAFAVWRWDTHGGRSWPFYVAITCPCVNTISGDEWTYEGAVSDGSGTSYIGFSTAVGIGGDADANPWKGTVNNDGSDTVGTPRWGNPTGGTGHVVLPSTNYDGGASVPKEDTIRARYDYGTSTGQVHRQSIIMDDDSLIFLHDNDDDGDEMEAIYIGPYEPVAHLTVPRPLVALRVTNDVIAWAHDDRSGVVGPDGTGLYLGMAVTSWFDAGGVSPDVQAGGAHIPHRLVLYSRGVGQRGVLGLLPDTYTWLFGNLVGGDTNSALDRIVWGETWNKVLVPWDGATTPGSTLVREGVTF